MSAIILTTTKTTAHNVTISWRTSTRNGITKPARHVPVYATLAPVTVADPNLSPAINAGLQSAIAGWQQAMLTTWVNEQLDNGVTLDGLEVPDTIINMAAVTDFLSSGGDVAGITIDDVASWVEARILTGLVEAWSARSLSAEDQADRLDTAVKSLHGLVKPGRRKLEASGKYRALATVLALQSEPDEFGTQLITACQAQLAKALEAEAAQAASII